MAVTATLSIEPTSPWEQRLGLNLRWRASGSGASAGAGAIDVVSIAVPAVVAGTPQTRWAYCVRGWDVFYDSADAAEVAGVGKVFGRRAVSSGPGTYSVHGMEVHRLVNPAGSNVYPVVPRYTANSLSEAGELMGWLTVDDDASSVPSTLLSVTIIGFAGPPVVSVRGWGYVLDQTDTPLMVALRDVRLLPR